jgi:hypothetical protein
MQLKGIGKVLLAVGGASLLFYAVLTLYVETTANRRMALLFVACVGLLAGALLYLLSTSQRRL